jgi:drug/metabolite transporter (DMT)-like permease
MNQENKLKVALAFAAVYIVWGSTYISIIIALKTMPPFILSAIRFLIAGTLLLGWSIYKGNKLPDMASLGKNAICGILLLFGGTVSVAWSEQYLPSSIAAIIVTAVPFWFILLDKKQWQYYLNNKIILLGLFVGFIGVAVLVIFNHTPHPYHGDSNMQVWAALALLAGGIGWTTGSLYNKYNPPATSVLMNAAIQLSIAGVFTLLVSVITGEWNKFNVHNVTTAAWTSAIYLALFGSLVTYLAYLWLLKVRSPAQVSTYVYVNPIVALILGAIVAHEKITGLQVLALSIILSGVLLVNLAKFRTLYKKQFN